MKKKLALASVVVLLGAVSFVLADGGFKRIRELLRGYEEVPAVSTVAEGVEHLEDWRLLQDFGCTTAQGWLIAKAMPPEELPGWNRAHGARLAMLRAAP